MSDGTPKNIEGMGYTPVDTGESKNKPKEPGKAKKGLQALRRAWDLGFEIRSRQVLFGGKPGAYIDYRSPKVYEKYGLEAIPTGLTREGVTTPPNQLAIALRGSTVESVIENRGVPQIPEIQEKIDTILEELKGKSVARALAELHEMPLGKNGETPEVAAAEGLLLGYNLCCINYYVETRHLDKPRSRHEGGFGDVLCPDCARIVPLKKSSETQ